jgi:hypothetical protein
MELMKRSRQAIKEKRWKEFKNFCISRFVGSPLEGTF